MTQETPIKMYLLISPLKIETLLANYITKFHEVSLKSKTNHLIYLNPDYFMRYESQKGKNRIKRNVFDFRK